MIERHGRAPVAFVASMAAGALGAIVLIAGLFLAPRTVAVSYLAAYTATLAVVLGMLLMIMMAHLSSAVWFVLLRRQAEAVVAALPMLAILMVPFLLAPHAFWPWAAPVASLPEPLRHTVEAKGIYLHRGFFTLRGIAYWAAWLWFGERLYRTSRLQDAGANDAYQRRFRVLSAAGIPAAALALTFASFDWMMSLSPDWQSSVFGMYYFAGAMVGALALLAVLAWKATARRDEWAPTTEHFQALGRLTLAFVLLWIYLWYSQFFIVWIADIPREAAWYAVRLRSGWRVLGLSIVVTGFVIPFLALAFRAARGSAVVMGILGVWLLVVHYVDVYWLVVPSVRPGWSFGDLLLDAGAIAFVAGSTTAFAVWRQAGASRVPAGDPQLEWSVQYEAH